MGLRHSSQCATPGCKTTCPQNHTLCPKCFASRPAAVDATAAQSVEQLRPEQQGAAAAPAPAAAAAAPGQRMAPPYPFAPPPTQSPSVVPWPKVAPGMHFPAAAAAAGAAGAPAPVAAAAAAPAVAAAAGRAAESAGAAAAAQWDPQNTKLRMEEPLAGAIEAAAVTRRLVQYAGKYEAYLQELFGEYCARLRDITADVLDQERRAGRRAGGPAHVRVAHIATTWRAKPLRDFVAHVPYDIGTLLPQVFDDGARQTQQPLRDLDRELLKNLQDPSLEQQEVLARFSPAWENGKFECTRGDFLTLRAGGMLSGNVINFYNKLIEQRCRECPGGPKVRAVSSQFYARLMKFGEKVHVTEEDNPDRYDYSAVRRWTRRWNPCEDDILLIPVNRGRRHWALVSLDSRVGEISFYDSTGFSGDAPMRNLLRWLNDVYKDKNGGEPWPLLNEILQKSPGKSVPQQSNGADCGVFALLYGSCITAGSQFGFDQDDIPYWRDRVCVEIHAARSPQAP